MDLHYNDLFIDGRTWIEIGKFNEAQLQVIDIRLKRLPSGLPFLESFRMLHPYHYTLQACSITLALIFSY